jgi:CRISPR-associated protein Cas1
MICERNLYVTSQGAILSRKSSRLVIKTQENEEKKEIPFFQIRGIYIFGRVEITNSCLTYLLVSKIDVVFLTLTGRYKGRLMTKNQNLAKTRILQYQKTINESFRLKTAKTFVKGKLYNYLMFCQRHHYRNKQKFSSEIIFMKDIIRQIENAICVEQLLGIEGTGSKIYFSIFRKILKQEFYFEQRIKRPPPDPVNSLLSFGYTLLYQFVYSAINRAGLDSSIGMLHSIQDRRESLVLDLMEEFRPVIIDSTVLTLINRFEIFPDNFETIAGRTKLSPKIIGLFVKRIEEKLATKTLYTYLEKNITISYQEIVLFQAYQFRRYIQEKINIYEPVRINI